MAVDDVHRGIRIPDVLLLLSVPLVLVGVHMLPETVRTASTLGYHAPTVPSAFTTHYVHAGWTHLLRNVATYLFAAAAGYLLFAFSGRRRSYLLVFLVLVVGLPLPLSYFDLLLLGDIVGEGTTRGFSGVASGFVGVLPVAVFLFLRERVSPDVGVSQSIWLWLVGLLAALAIYGRLGERLAAAGLALVAAGYYVRLWSRTDVGRVLDPDVVGPSERTVLLAALSLYLASPLALFPLELGGEHGVTNVVVHLLGLVAGYLSAVGVVELLDREVGSVATGVRR